jgi:hypothetical protein
VPGKRADATEREVAEGQTQKILKGRLILYTVTANPVPELVETSNPDAV